MTDLRKYRWLPYAAIVAVILLFLLAGYGVRESRERAQQQRYELCIEVEKVKTAQREEAWEDWRNLDRNLKILGIAKTPEIVDTAKESRENTLRRFAAIDCEMFR